jgi:C1A family cysteine protease
VSQSSDLASGKIRKLYENASNRRLTKTGVLNMPQPDEKTVGGHAVMAVGYDDYNERFIVRNSWDPKWGLKGYFTMPYESSRTGTFPTISYH